MLKISKTRQPTRHRRTRGASYQIFAPPSLRKRKLAWYINKKISCSRSERTEKRTYRLRLATCIADGWSKCNAAGRESKEGNLAQAAFSVALKKVATCGFSADFPPLKNPYALRITLHNEYSMVAVIAHASKTGCRSRGRRNGPRAGPCGRAWVERMGLGPDLALRDARWGESSGAALIRWLFFSLFFSYFLSVLHSFTPASYSLSVLLLFHVLFYFSVWLLLWCNHLLFYSY